MIEDKVVMVCKFGSIPLTFRDSMSLTKREA
jgi:hypothetical protein